MLRILIPAISGVFAIVDWVAVDRRERRVEYVAKPGVMVFLVMAALAMGADSSAQRRWFVLALVFSLAGDVFLMLPVDRFVFGLASFLVAHVFYVVGFAAEPGGLSLARGLGAAEVVVLLAVLVGRPILQALGSSSPSLQGPVVAYMTVISLMVATAAASSDWLALLGALLFYWSDATIAWNRFVRPFPAAKVVIIVTYHLAQFALVGSLLV